MFEFTVKTDTNNKTKGVNKCKYIILHHTAGKTFEGDLRVLTGKTTAQVSCHFLVGPNGETAKIGTPEDILRHAGVSTRGQDIGINYYGIGIEVTGPGFTDIQREKVKLLTEHLMNSYGIPKENVLRHADITHDRSKDKVLRTQGTRSRKRDLAPEFFKEGFDIWRNNLNNYWKQRAMTLYQKLLQSKK